MAKQSALAPAIRPGTVVEFMQGDQPQLAWTLEENSGKLRLLTINKREMKLPAARLLPWSGPVHDADANRQEIQDLLNVHQERRGEIQAAVDVMELWELAQGELDAAGLEWFAGLLWESPEPDELAALGRAMLSAKTHFKFRPPKFEIWPEEKVEQRLREKAEEKAREAVTAAGQSLLKELWAAYNQGRKPRIPNLEDDLETRLRAILRAKIGDGLDEEERKIWNAVSKGLPDAPHLALLLAQTWGVVEPHHNYLLDEADYAWGDEWHQSFNSDVSEIENAFSDEAPQIDGRRFVSVDGATTRDIDDAFHIERDGPDFLLTVALARPDAHWRFGSDLDAAVLARATSLYLPEGEAHMLPERFGTGLYSLIAGEDRPVLLAEFRLDGHGALMSATPKLGWINVAANLTYDVADEAVDNDDAMRAAHDLAVKLMERRIQAGACVIRKPEPVVSVQGQGADSQVDVSLKAPCPRSELIISEFMILANAGLAGWARDNGVPLLHRTQDIALPQEAAGVFTDPADIMRVVKLLMPPALETHPKRHAALGVAAYAPITSPLRRYTDFINMAQVASFLQAGSPRLDSDELERLSVQLGLRVKDVSAVQRFRPRYWKLVYLAERRKQFQDAVLVDEGGPMATLAMPHLQLNVRAPRKMLGDKLYPGQRFQINFSRIDPLANEIRLGEALEE